MPIFRHRRRAWRSRLALEWVRPAAAEGRGVYGSVLICQPEKRKPSEQFRHRSLDRRPGSDVPGYEEAAATNGAVKYPWPRDENCGAVPGAPARQSPGAGVSAKSIWFRAPSRAVLGKQIASAAIVYRAAGCFWKGDPASVRGPAQMKLLPAKPGAPARIHEFKEQYGR